MRDKIIQMIVGGIVVAIVWFLLLPLLTGIIHTIAAVAVVLLVILWLLWLGGIINS